MPDLPTYGLPYTQLLFRCLCAKPVNHQQNPKVCQVFVEVKSQFHMCSAYWGVLPDVTVCCSIGCLLLGHKAVIVQPLASSGGTHQQHCLIDRHMVL